LIKIVLKSWAKTATAVSLAKRVVLQFHQH